MKQFNFKIPITPVPKGRPRFSINHGRLITRTPEKTRDFEKILSFYLKTSFGNQCKISKKTPLIVDITCFLPIPNSYSLSIKEKCANGFKFPTKRPDVDNFAKAILDSMNDLIFEDDSQIVDLRVKKRYSQSITDKVGSIEITVSTIEGEQNE